MLSLFYEPIKSRIIENPMTDHFQIMCLFSFRAGSGDAGLFRWRRQLSGSARSQELIIIIVFSVSFVLLMCEPVPRCGHSKSAATSDALFAGVDFIEEEGGYHPGKKAAIKS